MGATKDDIAATFERHVQHFGYQKTTLDEVAAELHISKKTIYTHFDGKADVYAYIVARLAAGERRRMASAIEGLPDWSAKLGGLLDMVLEMARTHVTETTESDWMHEYAIAADAFSEATGGLIQEIVEGGMAAGEFRDGDVTLVRRMLAAIVVEYVLMVRAEPTYDRDEELRGRVVRFVS